MENHQSGFLLIDKPPGLTSHDVVARLRRITGLRKIGHAGTLDPFATGLLVVGIGREATKRLGEMSGKYKTYEAVAVLGASSDTQDLTGKIVPTLTADGQPVHLPKETAVREAAAGFLGPIDQIPPMYSAKKINGQKLYDLARAGQVVERKPVQVTIHELEITGYGQVPPRLSFRTTVSAGTYIRTLAHDIGQKLGCGAYLETLRRTKSGEYEIEDAVRLEELTRDNWQNYILGQKITLATTPSP